MKSNAHERSARLQSIHIFERKVPWLLMAVGERVPAWVSRQMGLTAHDLLDAGAVTALMGTTDQMCETLLRRRDSLGISYVVVSEEMLEALAPVVERPSGH